MNRRVLSHKAYQFPKVLPFVAVTRFGQGIIMGGSMSSCFARNPARIVILGLDAAGKTTILYKFLKNDETVDTFPTVGFNTEQFTYRHLPMILWDFGGQMIVRNLRRKRFEEYDGIIFVVDAADRQSFQEARDELWTFLSFAPDLMEHPVLLVLANKQDLDDAATEEELIKALDLKKLNSKVMSNTQWRIQSTCAISGEGLDPAMEWLTKTIKENRRKTVQTTYI